MTSFRTFSFAVLLALTPLVAHAADPGSCSVSQTSRVDSLLNPVVGGDERFFAASGSPTTLMFLVSTYNTMQEYVAPLPNSATGCPLTGSMATGFKAFYDPLDASKNGLTPIDDNSESYESGFSKFFDPGLYYRSAKTKLDSSTLNPSSPQTVNGWDATNACSFVSSGNRAACVTCVTTVGWYRQDDTHYVLKGAVLNENPPKFVTTRAVVKGVAESVSNVRMGFAAFNVGSNVRYDPPRIPVFPRPACSALNPIDNGAIVSAIASQLNTIQFTGSEQQIGEALFGIGGYFSKQSYWKNWFDGSYGPSNYPHASGWTDATNEYTESVSGYPASVKVWDTDTTYPAMCSPCQQNMVIVLTDGKPDADNSVPESKMMDLLTANNVKRQDGTTLTFSANSGGSCPSGNTGGINFCDRFGVTKCQCDYATSPQGPDNGNKNFMDDVAFFLANYDLRPDTTNWPGDQKLYTYTIGIGDTSDAVTTAMLKSIAYAGNGRYYAAANASQLKDSVISAIQDVQSKASSFSGAAVAGLQTGSASEAILPRMLPRGQRPWTGSLWRFEIFNEFIEGRQLDGGAGNGSLAGVYMIDDAGVPVTENLTTGQFYQTGGTVPAKAFWEAGEVLWGGDNSINGHTNRKLYTVRDSSGDGRFSNAALDGGTDQMLEFSVANRTNLKEYLGVVGTKFCPKSDGTQGTMLDTFGLTADQFHTAVVAANGGTDPVSAYSSTSQTALDDLCVAGLILYVRGADFIDEDGDGNRSETRRSVLADIFHSTPVTVQPPVETFLCDLGVINQCARTLYAQQLNGIVATPLDAAHGTPLRCDGSSAAGRTAYDDYQFYGRRRDRVVLVGSNDGVLHAFHNGDIVSEDCAANTQVYNQGNGKEVWGFIPPDLLPRLQEGVPGHIYGVDGDIMVRDIWSDRNNDNTKQWDEFHTVAIVGEGRGGTHYFALDLQWQANQSDGHTSGLQGDAAPPRFLWMFPQPGTPTSAIFGKTIANIAPKPPPIGPVLLQKSGGKTRTVGSFSGETEERWVVALPGGWSPGRERGRGVYVVDAYTGIVDARSGTNKPRDNLIAKFEFTESASGDLAPLSAMGQSVAAPVALVDYGPNSGSVQDGFFDTAIWGDVNGQVWLARMMTPGALDSSGLVNNWRVGRAFEIDRYRAGSATVIADPYDGGTDDGGTPGPDPDDSDVRDNRNREPFYYLPSAVVEPGTGYLRIFLGTGDRNALLDKPTGVCRYDNPLACSQSQCDLVRTNGKVDFSGFKVDRMEATFRSQEFAKGRLGVSHINYDKDKSCDDMHAWFDRYEVDSCHLTDGTTVNPGRINDSDVKCKTTGGLYSCGLSSNPTVNTGDLLPAATANTGNIGGNRYFGFWAYGGTRVFNEGDSTAATYDTTRVTDYDSTDGGTGLVNVTSTSCSAPGSCTGPTANANGWYLEYTGSGFDESRATKTATGSTILASCALWNTVTPSVDGGLPCQAGAGAPEARLVQANYLTGAPDCAAGFQTDGGMVRFLSRNVVAPPPEPATVIQVSKTGQVRTSALLVEPGKSPTNVAVTNGQDVLQLIYQLPISRSMHNCRHVPGGDDGGCITNP